MADYSTILTAIDAAVEAGVTKPGSFSAMGETINYRNLADLLAARKHYEGLQSGTGTVRSKFKLAKIRSGAAI